MTTVEYYLERAVACEKIAAAATSDEHRQRMLKLARSWRDRANYHVRMLVGLMLVGDEPKSIPPSWRIYRLSPPLPVVPVPVPVVAAVPPVLLVLAVVPLVPVPAVVPLVPVRPLASLVPRRSLLSRWT